MSGEKVTPIRGHLRDAGAARQPPGGGYIPEDCPVIPLGKNGMLCHYLDADGSYVMLEAKAHSKNTLYGLFGQHSGYLVSPSIPFAWAKGRDEQTNKPKDFKPDKVAESLIQACSSEGPFGGHDMIRGRGAWPGEDGDLVVHLGNRLVVQGKSERVGKRDRYVYTRQPPREPPATERQPEGDEGPAAELARLLGCWNWRRPRLDQRLMLGFICAGWVCAALDWRPQMWLGGERGSGKSTLIKKLIGEVLHRGESCIVTDDPTPAALRAGLQYDSLVVIYDEAEPSEDNGALNRVIDLARSAASGGVTLRSTADHGFVAFTVRFMGLFSSVLKPPLKAQDLSRIAWIGLRKNNGRPPLLQADMLRMLGRRLHRRMIDQWGEFQNRLPLWREALLNAGLDARGADQFGTLLTAADVALHDLDPDSDTLAEWAELVVAGTKAERAEEMPEWRRCLEHVATSPAPQWRGGEQGTVGRLIALAARRAVLVDNETGEPMRPTTQSVEDAQRALGALGLRVVPELAPPDAKGKAWPLWQQLDENGQPMGEPQAGHPPAPGRGEMLGFLAVSNTHASLNTLFRNTHWQGRSGASGGWKPALEDAPGARTHREMRFGGLTSRSVLVPLALVLDGDGESEGE
ncbi:Ras_like_GTPase domain containing protein [uncultured Caudovirales phage]|uniref:Ras_like_GTPase domain containing protein n=1 Tax=uncultured Caudovirales phage TaxID=2100421 RepID=A0A6J5L9L8_9CAUD|nr:Ras_like_GTPase domain containing protein [uncultured Caudovirales phage]